MTGRNEWQGRVGESWADEWRRTDRSFGGLTDRLLEVANARPFRQALDIGCGAGEVSLALARANPRANVVGIDVSEKLIEMARDRGASLGNLEFVSGDAARWEAASDPADLLVSRHGVMFFDDPYAAFGQLARGAHPDARLVFSCFRARGLNPWASEISRLLGSADTAPDPEAPGPFAFADPAHVTGILRAAGWIDIGMTEIDYAYVAGAGDNPVADALGFVTRIGPAASAIRDLGEAERDQLMIRLRSLLASFAVEGVVAFPAAAWIVTARPGGRR
ncbi:class I SAM-dependent methyltransferase [Qipengyuania sp. JC766]|uniref:class I SAM-dependent methyltransferase n=1 Tax=Qipengyuania sp. JC766 TaxID=3232139 RepID=UPI003457B310